MKKADIVLACLLLAAFAVGLSGGSLAAPDGDRAAQPDRLVGVFLTREHLDLFDTEGWLNDHAGSLSGNTVIPNDPAYQERLYAEVREENGRVEIDFSGVEGLPFFYRTIRNESGSAIAFEGGDSFTDGNNALRETNEGTSVSLDGTLHVAAGRGDIRWFFNPVYETEDGALYATGGQGVSMDGGNSAEGMSSAHSFAEEYTVTENGESRTDSVSIKVTVAVMYPPERIAVVQYGADGGMLARTEYAPEEVPNALTTRPGADWLVVETARRAPDGTPSVTRALFEREDMSMRSFVCRADGVCAERSTALTWMEGESH